MATKGSSNPERIARWKVMTTSLKPQLGDLPLLAPLHAELEGTILQSEELDARHEALKAETREVNRLRDELAKKGDDLRNRMAATLQTIHGFKSEKLIEFGVQPRRTRGRDRQARKRRNPEQPTQAPAATATDTTQQ
jgi:hypothetical protein